MDGMDGQSPGVVRERCEVRGLVQGVGFRPWVCRLAREAGLVGWVANHTAGVTIEVEGPTATVAEFLGRLVGELPAPARIDQLGREPVPPRGETEFTIAASELRGGAVALILPDLATCADCRRELTTAGDRRQGYAFTNCTRCGPRFTIIRDVPYDRPQTTMSGFTMCADCDREYHDPADRRFHAQPNACPSCGPRVELVGSSASPSPRALCACGADEMGPGGEVAAAAALLRAGGILAVKGLGGYHLACDAANSAAVQRLRERKQREARPLAVMVAGLAAAAELAVISGAEADLLTSPAAPIVLLTPRSGAPLAPEVAPDVTTVGVMLAYTPLHVLLLAEFGGPLVMTSGNRSDEPIAHQDDDAQARLSDIADALLIHDRPIQRRCDDSVVMVVDDEPLPLRRSRGWAPAPLRLNRAGEAVVLAVGGHQKNTFCLVRGDEAFLSPHVGDLENDRALAAFETGIADFERLFELRPTVLAHDLHPDYLATRYAMERARRDGLRSISVQHHHAHIAACLADNEADGPVIGVAFDGTGLGPDGTVWGGEILLADRRGSERVGHLRPFHLAGGDAAVRQGWRVALDLLRHCGLPAQVPGAPPAAAEFIGQMLAHQVRCVVTTSAGRLFDGVSALLGCRAASRYEGEGAVALEGACAATAETLPFDLAPADGVWQIDWRPAVRTAFEKRTAVTAGELATAFHHGLAAAVVRLCRRLADEHGVATVALSGGCLVNRRLAEALTAGLKRVGLDVLRHRRVPPNDGGLSLGQAVVAQTQT